LRYKLLEALKGIHFIFKEEHPCVYENIIDNDEPIGIIIEALLCVGTKKLHMNKL
jgi:hypothetical protein